MSWIKPDSCYVIMPFSGTTTQSEPEWTDIFTNFFKPIMESLGYSCERSKALVGTIFKDVVESLHSSLVILADLTDAKPNVFYELGIAHTITNNVIMVSQNLTNIPSDLRAYGVIQYDHKTKQGAVKFTSDVSEALGKLLRQQAPKKASPILEYLGLTHRYLEGFYPMITNPVAVMRCAKCNMIYEVPINGMTQGAGDQEKGFGPQRCGHWEPAVFLGIMGYSLCSYWTIKCRIHLSHTWHPCGYLLFVHRRYKLGKSKLTA